MYLGLLFAVLTGLTWVITGAIVGSAERRGCGAFRQQLVSTVLSLSAVSIALVAGRALWPESRAFAFGASPRWTSATTSSIRACAPTRACG